MNIKQAVEIVGTLSEPSKMPCHGFSIPARYCITGSKLRLIPGSVCNKCYAGRGNYQYENVEKSLQKRYDKLTHSRWIEAMSYLITVKETSGYFRWHDSGDLQNMAHLHRIVKVAINTPHIIHWLPTKEYAIVAKYIRVMGKFPPNLIVRLSAYTIEGKPPVELAKSLGVNTSTVSKTDYTCPAPRQGNKCQDCRLCWDKNVMNVTYKKH